MELARHRALTHFCESPPCGAFAGVEMELARHRALTHYGTKFFRHVGLVEMELARHRALTQYSFS